MKYRCCNSRSDSFLFPFSELTGFEIAAGTSSATSLIPLVLSDSMVCFEGDGDAVSTVTGAPAGTLSGTAGASIDSPKVVSRK